MKKRIQFDGNDINISKLTHLISRIIKDNYIVESYSEDYSRDTRSYHHTIVAKPHDSTKENSNRPWRGYIYTACGGSNVEYNFPVELWDGLTSEDTKTFTVEIARTLEIEYKIKKDTLERLAPWNDWATDYRYSLYQTCRGTDRKLFNEGIDKICSNIDDIEQLYPIVDELALLHFYSSKNKLKQFYIEPIRALRKHIDAFPNMRKPGEHIDDFRKRIDIYCTRPSISVSTPVYKFAMKGESIKINLGGIPIFNNKLGYDSWWGRDIRYAGFHYFIEFMYRSKLIDKMWVLMDKELCKQI